MFEIAALGVGTGFFAALMSWQINLVAIQKGLERGRSASFFVGLGSVTADLGVILGVLTGASAIIHNPKVWLVFKGVGIATVSLLGLRILFKKPPAVTAEKKKRNPAKNFLLGFFLVVTNPAILILWIGIMSFILTHSDLSILANRGLFLAGFAAGGTGWFLIFALAVVPYTKQWKNDYVFWFFKITALALFVAGIWILLKKI